MISCLRALGAPRLGCRQEAACVYFFISFFFSWSSGPAPAPLGAGALGIDTVYPRLKPPLVLLSICFSHLLLHDILPDSLLTVTLVPVIKDKAGKAGSLANYRPIALASILSKVLERILLDRLSVFISTTDNQFGFKAKHSTDLCIYALKRSC